MANVINIQAAKFPVIADDLMIKVFESAAKLQELVPNAVLVGGSAVSAHIGHRYSIDHDQVIEDLNKRFEIILSDISKDNWKTYKAIQDKVILGELDGIQAGIRQLRRRIPLETEELTLENGNKIVVPTIDETLRVKAYLIVNRNQVRDYLDVVAISDNIGVKNTAKILLKIDDYYSDLNKYKTKIITELTERLANPNPKDSNSIDSLENYKGTKPEYKVWDNIIEKSQNIAKEIIDNA